MKILILFISLCLFLSADTLKVNDKFPFSSFNDQFDKKLVVTSQTKEIIVSFSKDNGKIVKAFLENHKGYLKKRQGVFLVDMTSAPSFAMVLFMKPMLQKYDFLVGFVEDDKVAKRLPKVEGKITVISLEKRIIKSIKYVDGL